jgi:WD40 repeat protein
MCVQTFYGHNNAVNGVAFNTTGDLIASCDADGIVKLWDVRAISERATLDCGDRAVNKVRCRLSVLLSVTVRFVSTKAGRSLRLLVTMAKSSCSMFLSCQAWVACEATRTPFRCVCV